MLELVARHLRSIEQPKLEVIEASDGDEAWRLARERLPDLVVLDVMMPGMSGWEVCRKIRQDAALAHTGVLMLTGIGESLNETTSPLFGADEYIDKPFDFEKLDEKIVAVLRAASGATRSSPSPRGLRTRPRARQRRRRAREARDAPPRREGRQEGQDASRRRGPAKKAPAVKAKKTRGRQEVSRRASRKGRAGQKSSFQEVPTRKSSKTRERNEEYGSEEGCQEGRQESRKESGEEDGQKGQKEVTPASLAQKLDTETAFLALNVAAETRLGRRVESPARRGRTKSPCVPGMRGRRRRLGTSGGRGLLRPVSAGRSARASPRDDELGQGNRGAPRFSYDARKGEWLRPRDVEDAARAASRP